MSTSLRLHNLGYPSMGDQRQLKKSLESFWQGKSSEADLQTTARELRRSHWTKQKEAGLDLIPSNDFSFYDRVLDTAALVGAVPERFGKAGSSVDLKTYFAMARGADGVPAMEMTKWFDTNYHYIVPEFAPSQTFGLSSAKPLDEFKEALALGLKTKPVLIGPLTFLKLGKIKAGDSSNPVFLWKNLVPVYVEVLKKLAEAGAEWVQLDEPIFSLDLVADERKAILEAYQAIRAGVPSLKILVANYFGRLSSNLETFTQLPVDALHVDLFNAASETAEILKKLGWSQQLSLGVVEGRNIWKNDYVDSLQKIRPVVDALGAERVWLGPSCSLLHSPVSLKFETKLNPELKNWLAFADEKLVELSEIRRVFEGSRGLLEVNQAAQESRKKSSLIHRPAVKARAKAVKQEDFKRGSVFSARQSVQHKKLGLPVFATTTIGSFPQTEEVRSARAKFRKGDLSAAEYDKFLKEETKRVIRWQEEIGLDVLVHGEFERTDMVEYFGENLQGFAFTQNGWVQSYGSRCVKPPVIFGDVERPSPMTVEWAKFAQAQTKKPMKGMLTGPITILQWSFVRNDQPRSETAQQIALALRDEVKDLEEAGIAVIQVDEPALREGLPLRREDWEAYLRWAVDAFRLSTAVVRDETQIHTHMCYCEFNDIIQSIAELDADVISIESSRSGMEILEAFRWFKYPNEVGPGVWDIHSPRVPSVGEMETLGHKALERLNPSQFWVNPDCGLKTRGWKEVGESLANMVQAAKDLRREAKAGRS